MLQQLQNLQRLREVRILGRHCTQQGLDEGLEHRDLVLRRRIHDEVGTVLVREDPNALALADVVPHLECSGGRVASEEVVPAHPPQQPVVRRLHSVRVIQLQSCERRDEDLENVVRRHSLRVQRVQRVDALDDEDAVGRHCLELVALPVSVAGLHVVDRSHHGLASNKVVQMLTNHLYVHGLDVVVVHIRPLLIHLVLGLSVQRQVVVVNRERLRDKAHVLQVHAELVRERRLPRRRWPRDADDLDGLPIGFPLLDRGGDVCQLLLLSELACEHKVLAAPADLLEAVQRSDGGDSERLGKAEVVLVRAQQRWLRDVCILRIGHDEARGLELDVKLASLQRRATLVHLVQRQSQDATAHVALDLRLHPRVQQPSGACQVVLLEIIRHLLPWLLDLGDRIPRCDQVLQLLQDLLHLVCSCLRADQLVEVPLAESMSSTKGLVWEGKLRGHGDGESQGPPIKRVRGGCDFLRHVRCSR
mmetsp:Transcript_63444/g.182095  ORF Transcript_63444/g.182095 Transcript_63444/m.182095 type:complete len:475 (-) Transcript_63444:60-1484(-)